MILAPGLPTRILVVDDQTATALESMLTLASELYTVTAVRTGTEALQVLATNEFDVALVDVVLSAFMDGVAVTAAIRDQYPRTRVIVFSGQVSHERKKEALRADAFMFLGKPIDEEELRLSIERINTIRRREIYGEKFQTLSRIAFGLQATRDLDALADQAVGGAKELGFDRARLYLLDEARDTLVGKAERGMEMQFVGYQVPITAQPIIAGIFRATRPMVWDREELQKQYPQADAEQWLSDLDLERIRWIDCPLVVGNHRIGTLAVDHHEHPEHFGYLEEDIQILGLLAGLVAHALNNSRLYQHEELAHASLNAVLRDSPDAVVTTDLQGIMTRVSPSIERLTGFSAEEMRGRRVSEFCTDETGAAKAGDRIARELMAEVEERKILTNKTVHLGTPSGVPCRTSLSLSLLFDSAGTKIGTVGILKELAPPDPRLEHYRNLLERFGYGTILLDHHGRITFLNSKAARLLHLSGSASEGAFLTDVLPEGLGATLAQASNEVREQNHKRSLSLEIRPPGSRTMTVQAELMPHVIGGDVKGVQVAIYGAKELTALIQTGRLMVLGEMLNDLAHELNNPLNNIQLTLQNVTERLEAGGQLSKEAIAPSFDVISRNSERVLALVRRLREFARPREFKREPIDLEKLIRDSLALFGSKLYGRNIEIEVVAPPGFPFALGEPTRLQQVLVNLIANADEAMELQAGPKRIEISLSLREQYVILRFCDTGPGVPSSIREALFEPFVTTKGGLRGTGLGLAISKSILEMHEGSIELVSAANCGACFEIRLPVAPAQEGPDQDGEEADK